MRDHTPTPWVAASHFAERLGGRTYIPIMRPGNDPVPVAVVHRDVDSYGKGEGEANAAFIVKAVNSHEALVKALQAISKIECGPVRAATDIAREALAQVKP